MVDVKGTVSSEEWETRVDLAAFYRTIPHFNWDDLIFTHISAKVPGTDDHFLINPYGFLFEEITASNLVKVDLKGNAYYTKIHEQLSKKYGVEKVTVAQLGGLECGKCHY